MDYGTLRNQYGETVDPTQPIPMDSVEAQQVLSQPDTITYNGKAAAGAISVNSTKYKSIVSVEGDQVASFWGLEKNKVYEAFYQSNLKKGKNWVTSLTETATAAAVVIADPDKNLEEMFESVTGTVKRFVLKATDTSGGVLYGWIFGVSASSGVYTINIVNNRLTETQSWVGTLSAFDNTSIEKVEIFRYNSSLSFGTGTTFTEEVICPREYSKSWKAQMEYAETLANGQYFVDYMRGRIIGVKADTVASETLTYNIWVSISNGATSTSANVGILTVGGVAVPTVGADAVSNTRTDLPTSARISGFNGTTWDRIKAGITTVTATLTGWLNTLPWAVYNATPTTRTEGQGGPLQATAGGSLKTRTDGYDTTTDSVKKFDVNPLSAQFVNGAIDVDTTNVDATTHYHPSSLGATMDGAKDNSLSGKLIDADGTLTLTLQVTNDEDTTNADWKSIKFFDDDSAVGALVASLTVTNGTLIYAVRMNEQNYRYYRWVLVASGATNTVIMKGRTKAV